jgi:polar amino acid transport system permease protein
MNIDLHLFVNYGPQLLHGLKITIAVWLLGSAVAILLGLALALSMTSAYSGLTLLIRAYVEFFRGTPLLVQLFILYYGGPNIGLTLSAFTVGLLGLGLYGSAYFAEVFRAGLESVPAGQLEAAFSFGFSRLARIQHIVLPQMLLLVIPPSTNLLIILLKDTAVLSIVTVPELTFQVTGMTVETFAFIEPFMALAAFYWILTEITSYFGRRLEDRIGGYLHV